MAPARYIWAAIALGIALTARSVGAQDKTGTSSLTHVVSVTIAPRVRVEIGKVSPSSAASAPSLARSDARGLPVTVHATEAWVLSIRSGPRTEVKTGGSRLARKSATMFLLDPAVSGEKSGAGSSPPIVLTISAP
jgi:hypothetical protein